MNKQPTSSSNQPVNLKEQKAAHTFTISFRDREHFYKIVKWLNSNVGKGSDKWTMEGRPLRLIKAGKTANLKVYIFDPNFDTSSSLYLNLL